MYKLLSQLDESLKTTQFKKTEVMCESADKLLGQIFVKVGNKNKTLKDQELEVEDLARILAGFRVIGKIQYREVLGDVSSPKMLLKLLNDIDENGQEEIFGEPGTPKVTADERIMEIGETHHKLVNKYTELLQQLEDDPDNDEVRDMLQRDIGQMRTFFEQAKNKLKNHVLSKSDAPVTNMAPSPDALS